MNIGGSSAGRIIVQSLSAIKSRACRFGCGVSKLVRSLTRVGNSDSQPNKDKEWKAAKFPNGVGYAYISGPQPQSPSEEQEQPQSSSETQKKKIIAVYVDLIESSPELKQGFMSMDSEAGFCHSLPDH